MEITATAKYVHMSPRKLRLVADAIRGMKVSEVLDRLPFLVKSASAPILKTVKSAVANAVNNLKLNSVGLVVKNIVVDEGVRMKRQDKSHSSKAGRGIIQKRMSHIVVTVSDNG